MSTATNATLIIPKLPAKDMFDKHLYVGDHIVYLTHENGYHLLNYGTIEDITWFTPAYRKGGKIPKYRVMKTHVINGDKYHNNGLPRIVYLNRPNIIKRGVVI